MSWIGWIVVVIALALVVVIVQGMSQLASWFVERYVAEPRWRQRRDIVARNEEPTQQPREATPTGLAHSHAAKEDHRNDRKGRRALPIRTAAGAPRPSVSAKLLKLLRIAFAPKRYDHWVALALEEQDPESKVKYLAKALELDPTYLPGWGLKGNTLFDLKRYEEAMACFDKLLELQPSAFSWYHKATCCYHLQQPDEALRCLNKALAACTKQDSHLMEEAARLKQLIQDASQGKGVA